MSESPTRFARIEAAGSAVTALDPIETLAVRGGEVGDWVGVADGAIVETLAKAGTARAALYTEAAERGLNPYFDAATLAETEAHLRAPLADPALEDLGALPFVTIDGPHSRDLDQALLVERDGDGYLLHYALADAAHFVARGSALFETALARGASFYFPGFAIPMLPRPLSEGLISLNPDGPRRALVFRVWLDSSGEVTRSEVARGIIRSRAKLAWRQVQTLYDEPAASDLGATEFAPSLGALAALGEILLDRAESRDLIRYHREEVDVSLDVGGLSFVVERAVRARVELYNEQISLLVNGIGARMLREHPDPGVEPIYRIHPAPDEERLSQLRSTIARIVSLHRLDDRFLWREGSSLARYIASLPAPDDETVPPSIRRVARTLERQAIVTNFRSQYVTEPGEHFGVGLDPYGRFTAPMREIVGVFLHGETIEAFGLAGADRAPARDPDLRERVVSSGNRSREVQRSIADAANRLVIDRVLRADLELPVDQRPERTATVMGITGGKVHVSLDSPPLDLKLYLRELGKVLGGTWLTPGPFGVTLLDERGQSVFSVGDPITLRTIELDRSTDRWVLLPRRIHEDP